MLIAVTLIIVREFRVAIYVTFSSRPVTQDEQLIK